MHYIDDEKTLKFLCYFRAVWHMAPSYTSHRHIHLKIFITINCNHLYFSGAFKRCFVCRSRGELGTCKDKFSVNGTVEITVKGVKAVPCASGWCGKILETENQALKEEGG